MRIDLAGLFLVLTIAVVNAQQRTISFPSGVHFETGDTWTHEGRRYRLFGVQACIRGTVYRSKEGEEGDCGIRSIASLAALFSTGTIACQPIGAARTETALVVCAAEIDGATVDVGTALISSGAAFSATLPSGAPVTSAYAVAELTAKHHRTGLWSGTFDHPVTVLWGSR
ncbi:thermonuclease family protein [Neorhizobium lilium]|uniref:Thermonuclease family protein n=1 Tax=Neorhizobium lilium TaxID=2503024 RepID=A0A444LB68_9HYPH|nr:thermonuclease family protein [Neorhizobium lilium]RWX74875.1 thermonuclease family protein [Neorhizobium lilium]